jgi:hypothetical protein
MRLWLGGALSLVLAATGCDREPVVTDTGYVGTWARGTGRARSMIAIRRAGADGYAFRWGVSTPDDKWRVTCRWDGSCEEFVDGRRTSTYRFRTFVDPGTGRLRVTCTGTVTHPKPLAVHYVDELVVEPGGRVLWSYTVARGDQRFEGEARPKRSFEKVADAVADDAGG